MVDKLTLDEARRALAIDRDDLDKCLIEQPELYHAVADRYELAVAKRDAAELDLNELLAELDEVVRRKAAKDKEELTEKAIKSRLTNMPRIKELQHKYFEAKGLAGRWLALKESFEKRNFMLSKLVDRQVAQMNSLGLDRNMSSSRSGLADAALQRQRQHRERYGR